MRGEQDDVISRQAAIDAVKGLLDSMLETDTIGFYEIENILFEVPSAQPQLPEWAQKVEEYRKIAPKTFSSPIAWALYQTWREYAERRTDGN